MAASSELTLETVRVYILGKGGQVTNQEIAKHFRKSLKDQQRPELKSLFKDYVNVLAIVKKVGDEKVIRLREEYSYPPLKDRPKQTESRSVNSNEHYLRSISLDAIDNEVFDDEVPRPKKPLSPRNFSFLSRSSPDLPAVSRQIDSQDGNQGSSSGRSSSSPTGDVSPITPVVPPRKKSVKDQKKRAPQPPDQSKSSDMEETKPAESGLEITPRINVKEQASKLNKIVSQSQIDLVPGRPQTASPKKKDKVSDDDDQSVPSSDPRCREWLLKAAKGDYQSLARLLRDEPRLVNIKDIIYGYTALHWAAKRGNNDIIKLIAGTQKIQVNSRSNGGYTPLHIAAIHNHRATYDLLFETYHADINLRDYSGKKATQLFKDSVKINSGSKDQRKMSISSTSSSQSGKWRPRSTLLTLSMRERSSSADRNLFASTRLRKSRPISFV